MLSPLDGQALALQKKWFKRTLHMMRAILFILIGAIVLTLCQSTFSLAADNSPQNGLASIKAGADAPTEKDIEQPMAASRAQLQKAIATHEARKPVKLIAREMLLQKPQINDVQLSPDGRFVTYVQSRAQQNDLMLQDIDNKEATVVLADVKRLQMSWAGDSKTLWMSDELGLVLFDISRKTAKRIWKWDKKRQQKLFGVDPRATDVIVIQEKIAEQNAWQYRYLAVDRQGNSTLLMHADKPVRDLLLTENGQLAFTAAYEDTNYDTVIRHHRFSNSDTSVSKPGEIMRCKGVERCRLIGFNKANKTLFTLSFNGENHMRLRQWQASSNSWQTLHQDPSGIADVSEILWDNDKEDWFAIAYHPDHRHWYGNHDVAHQQLTELQSQLAHANFSLMISNDRKRWLVRATQANEPLERYYVYSPHSKTRRAVLEQQIPSQYLPSENLATAQPFSYRARDGMLIHAYVYLPSGKDLKKVPLIASLHGGPYNRDRDNYSPVTQLLVNRGYAVVTPNFRASTSYGQHYQMAAGGDFGNGKVLQDIIDGMDDLLTQGIGNVNQQAVIGHSFGGYASLLAVSHHPTRFRFAVASAAPIDFYWSMNWIAKNGGSALPEDGPPPALFFQQHGMPFYDRVWRENMKLESPLAQVRQLKTPIYLWAGALDDRVPLKEVTHYAAEAKRYGKSISLMIDPQSGHNPNTELNLEALIYLIEAAANIHFGGGVTPASSSLRSLMQKNLPVDDSKLREDLK